MKRSSSTVLLINFTMYMITLTIKEKTVETNHNYFWQSKNMAKLRKKGISLEVRK